MNGNAHPIIEYSPIMNNGIWPPIGKQWSEEAIQRYIAVMALRADLVFHGDANGSHKGAIGGNKMKLAGARKGWPDLCFVLMGRIVWIELKTLGGLDANGKRVAGGKVSDEQFALHGRMANMGCEVYVVKALDGPDGWVKVAGILNGVSGE